MKLRLIALWLAPAAIAVAAPLDMKNEKDKISYAIGVDIGKNITNRQVEINPDALAAGLKAVVTGAKLELSEEQLKEAMNSLQQTMQAKMGERMKQQQAA